MEGSQAIPRNREISWHDQNRPAMGRRTRWSARTTSTCHPPIGRPDGRARRLDLQVEAGQRRAGPSGLIGTGPSSNEPADDGALFDTGRASEMIPHVADTKRVRALRNALRTCWVHIHSGDGQIARGMKTRQGRAYHAETTSPVVTAPRRQSTIAPRAHACRRPRCSGACRVAAWFARSGDCARLP